MSLPARKPNSRRVAGLVIQHDSFRKALALLTDFLDNMFFDDGGALCAVISAPGRCGKSTLSAVLEKMLLDRQPPPRRGDPAYPRQRVLYVLTPQAATPLSLGQTILISAGDPAAAKLSQALVTNRVAETLSYCDTELLILDEFHHLFTTGSRAKAVEVASWLKTLLNTGVCGIILIGTEEINLVMAADTQLAGRCWCEATLAPFGFGDKAEKATFTKLISTLAKEQSLPLDPGLGASGLAAAVHLATGGTIGEVALLLRKAEAKAKRAGLAMLTAEMFSQAFDDRRFETPGSRKGVNPFGVLA